VLATDLVRGLDAVTQLAHRVGERVERRAARLSGQMGAAQLIADPLQICFQFRLPTHSRLLSLNIRHVALNLASGSRSQLAQAP
jgi:hypothetical protein